MKLIFFSLLLGLVTQSPLAAQKKSTEAFFNEIEENKDGKALPETMPQPALLPEQRSPASQKEVTKEVDRPTSPSQVKTSGKSLQSFMLSLRDSPGEVKFLAKGKPAAIKIKGVSTKTNPFIGELHTRSNQITGKVAFDLTTLDTGIELRNQHMLENYLEVEKWRYAQMQFTHFPLSQALTEPQMKFSNLPFLADLVLHGVKKPVEGQCGLKKNDAEMELDCRFSLELTDFNIDIPSYLGVIVSKTVDIEVSLGGQLLPHANQEDEQPSQRNLSQEK